MIARMLEHNLAALRYSNYHFFAGAYPNDQERQKDDQEDREQDLGYRSRPRRDIGEAERTGNQRDDEKDESPFQHGSTHEFCPSF